MNLIKLQKNQGEKNIKIDDINIKAYKEIGDKEIVNKEIVNKEIENKELEKKEVFLNNPGINVKDPESKFKNDFNQYLIKTAEDFFNESSSENFNNLENSDKSEKEDNQNQKKELAA